MNLNQSSRVYDQWPLAEIYGGDFSKSSMGMGILRTLRNNGELGEGELAARVGSRTFRPEWRPFIETLHEHGYVVFSPTGKGTSRRVSLTSDALEFLKERGIGKEVEMPAEQVEPQPTE